MHIADDFIRDEDRIKALEKIGRLRECSMRHVDGAAARAHIPVSQLDAYDEYRQLQLAHNIGEFLLREGLIVIETDRKMMGNNSITATLTVLVPEKENTDGQPV